MSASMTRVSVEISSQQIVDDVTMVVPDGQIVGLVGPNGSGKSTLLKTVYRALPPSSGVVVVDNLDVWKSSPRTSAMAVGAVCQVFGTTYDITVRDLVQLGRFPHSTLFTWDTTEADKIVDSALTLVGLHEKGHQLLSQLSGGERQRALIAKALAQTPRLLVLDEPTNHLDVRYQTEVLSTVKSSGYSALVTLHDLNLAAAYCDQLYLLSRGRIVAQGPPHVVLEPTVIEEVYGVKIQVTTNPLSGRLSLFFADRLPDRA